MLLEDKIDCIIVGYNDIDFRQRLNSLQASAETSAGFTALHLQSLAMDGQRYTYMEVINKILERIHGREYALHVGKMPSLGSWYLWNFLTKNGYRAEVINFFSSQKEEFKNLLQTQKPTAVAITTTFYIDDTPIREIANIVKENSPDTTVIVGGPHVFNKFQQKISNRVLGHNLKTLGADIFIQDSQGELTLTRVLSYLKSEETAHETQYEAKSQRHQSNSRALYETKTVSTRLLSDIPNLAFFIDGELVITPREIESNDMDIFSIDWEQVSPEHFVPTVITRTARSCAFACSFCRYPIIAGPLNLKSIETVIHQFDQFERSGIQQVLIIDDTFNVPLPRFKALCRAIAERNYSFEWFSYLRSGNLDEEAMDLIAESGCGGSFLGIESGDQNILIGMNKSAKVEQYLKGVKGLNERGIITFASLIIGFPGESRETVDNTIAFLEEAKPTYWRSGLYFHSTDAPISEKSTEYGISGHGYSWSHKTMDWREGISEIHRMLKVVKNSVYLPGYNFDLWGIPYLIGKGITKKQHLEFSTLAQKMLVRELNGECGDVAGELNSFTNIFLNE